MVSWFAFLAAAPELSNLSQQPQRSWHPADQGNQIVPVRFSLLSWGALRYIHPSSRLPSKIQYSTGPEQSSCLSAIHHLQGTTAPPSASPWHGPERYRMNHGFLAPRLGLSSWELTLVSRSELHRQHCRSWTSSSSADPATSGLFPAPHRIEVSLSAPHRIHPLAPPP